MSVPVYSRRPKPTTFAMVAGEASGDLLGAGLIRALKARYPGARFVGIGGPQMIQEGFHSLVPMERLSVMGLVEVLERLPELFDIRDRVRDYCLTNPPAAFIGIDAPDFTLGLEGQLRRKGVKTVHYVSPSVWAWRQGRIKKIARYVDLMLTLFPFEADFYHRHQVPVAFVGHPLADRIPLVIDRQQQRQDLGLDTDRTWVALLPGSRGGEVGKLAPLFLETARQLADQRPGIGFVLPCVNRARLRQVEAIIGEMDHPPEVKLVEGHSREVMSASDVVLLASGTATLEALLVKRPMVVAYKMAPFTFWLASRLVKIGHVALANLLASRPRVPEYLQNEATVENLVEGVGYWLDNPQAVADLKDDFDAVHRSLQCNADERAAEAIQRLINDQPQRSPEEVMAQ
ncbi:lipid-A-disaccharide synthase [Marinobacteraceae bacterium S3BR75-40.1]